VTLAVGVDIGGTKIAAGVVDTGTGTILARRRRPTPAHDGEVMAATIVDVVLELSREYDVSAVGLGVPGFVNRERDDIVLAPNLSLPSRPLVRHVREATGLTTIMENDGNAAAWAEYRFGAAAGHDDVLMIAAGTGIGGGVILDGRLHRGAAGMASEVGHLRVVPDGRHCGCGLRGCWEAYGSGTAMTARARIQVASGASAAGTLSELAGGRPESLDGAMVTHAAMQGDAFSRLLLSEVGSWLGAGIASLVAVLDPSVVVVGGGVGDAGELVMAPLRKNFTKLTSGSALRPVPLIVGATLGNDAGLVGVADLAAGGNHDE